MTALEVYALFYGPIILTLIAVFLLRSGLQNPNKYIWWRIISSLVILAIIIYWLYWIAKLSDFAPLFAGFIALLLTFETVLIGLRMLRVLQERQKVFLSVAVLAFLVLIWAGCFTGATEGWANSPNAITRQNGNQIVKALSEHFEDKSTYPKSLSELRPNYLETVPQALTTQGTGWVYLSTAKNFALAYWYWPEKFGAWVCLYETQNPEWVCDYNNWGPFPQVPTPQPR